MDRHEAPFYLRRVKEALVAFPDPETGYVKTLFTKRNVTTSEFQISEDELDFYDRLTRYVEDQSIKAAADDSARGRALAFTMAMRDEAQIEGRWHDKITTTLGDTTLDRIHQSMILFASGRGEAMKRFLIDDGAGRDQRFWRLAQALSALYPTVSEEKRWVDGVLARKKGLGL